MYQILHYLTPQGRDLFQTWLESLKDGRAQVRVLARVHRLHGGNVGDCRAVGQGVWELRIDYGPGYRVYYALAGTRIILLLCGGDKRKQTADIQRAIGYWQDYNLRK